MQVQTRIKNLEEALQTQRDALDKKQPVLDILKFELERSEFVLQYGGADDDPRLR